jgi:hypothetical protein
MKATDKLTDAARAYDRATDMQSRMPLKKYREEKTVAVQAGDRGAVSISGDDLDLHRDVMDRIGEDSSLLKEQKSADMQREMDEIAGHKMAPHNFDPPRPEGYIHGTHAELRLLVEEPRVPVGVTRNPCPENCDPGIQRLAASVQEDIVVRSPEGTTLYRSDGKVIPDPKPEQFTGVNSRWPGALWGAGGGAAAAGASAGGP